VTPVPPQDTYVSLRVARVDQFCQRYHEVHGPVDESRYQLTLSDWVACWVVELKFSRV
jgi:hypothetical protein